MKLKILGANGKMGKAVTELSQTLFSKKITLVTELTQAEAVIDFSSPEFVLKAISQTQNFPVFVVGSTGWTPEQKNELEGFSKTIPCLVASNFSIGVAIVREMLGSTASLFQEFGFQVKMREVHHTQKKDAPSGTALTLQADLKQNAIDCPIESIREGDVVGDHVLFFEGLNERITVQHEAFDRKIFARGAIEAALWLYEKQKKNPEIVGVFSFSDCVKDRAHARMGEQS